jgi:hypothetical protein
VLRPLLRSDLKLSISQVTASFIYTTEGYQIKFMIPKLTQPYAGYYLQTVPFIRENLWLGLSLVKFLVMNGIHETLDYEEVKEVCFVSGQLPVSSRCPEGETPS